VTAFPPQFNLVAAILAVGLVVYSITVQPVLGRRRYRRLVHEVDRDPGALTRHSWGTLGFQWSKAAVVFLVLVLAPGVAPAHLGLAWPSGPAVPYALWMTGAVAVAIVVGGAHMRWRAKRGRRVLGQRGYRALLPRTAPERRLALAVAVTAGICEELLFRGLFIAVGLGIFELSIGATMIATIVVFGAVHLYQGWLGMLSTAAVGYVFSYLYLMTGSLLLPVIVHILVDLRALLVVPAPSEPAIPNGQPASDGREPAPLP
jgi:membrane protease YdiL (CAAX protease family)